MADVIVVGAGAVGTATAYALARRGARVTILERSATPAGCSYGNAGLICPGHASSLASMGAIRDAIRWLARPDSPFYVRPRASLVPWLVRFAVAARPSRAATATAKLVALGNASLELHEQLAATLPTTFVRRGILSVFESNRALEHARRHANGDIELLDAREAREFEPGLSGRVVGAAFYPREAHCDPGAFVDAVLSGAQALGVDVRRGVDVKALRRSNGTISKLETSSGSLTCGTVVLAGGIWTRELARTAGIRLPLEAAKGYHVEIEGEPLRSGVPVYMEESRVVATPLAGRLRFAGTLELTGIDLGIDPVRLEALPRAAARVLTFPADARRVQNWCGLRSCTPDGVPLIGPVDGIDNLAVATGHAMLGITLAPITGELVADYVTGPD